MLYKSCFVSLSFWVFRSFSLPVRVFNMSVLWGPLVCSHLQHMSQLENQTSLLPWRWQRDPGCHLDTWAPRSTEVWTPPGWTPSRWPRIRPISGWHRSSNRGTLQYAAVSWCKYNDGRKYNLTKVLSGPIICLMRRHLRMSSSRSAPTFTLNLVQPLFSASVQSCRNTHS